MHQRNKKQVAEQDPSIPEGKDEQEKEDTLSFIARKLVAFLFFISASFGLHEVNFVNECLYSPYVNRMWFNLGLFFSSSVMLFASYIEVYRSAILNEKVSYETAKTSTHGMLISLIGAGIRSVLIM